MQNSSVSAAVTWWSTIPWNSLRSGAGNQAFSLSSIINIPKALEQVILERLVTICHRKSAFKRNLNQFEDLLFRIKFNRLNVRKSHSWPQFCLFNKKCISQPVSLADIQLKLSKEKSTLMRKVSTVFTVNSTLNVSDSIVNKHFYFFT